MYVSLSDATCRTARDGFEHIIGKLAIGTEALDLAEELLSLLHRQLFAVAVGEGLHLSNGGCLAQLLSHLFVYLRFTVHP